MTIVEFFERDAVENICSSLVSAPRRVILIGDNQKKMLRHAERYHSVLAARGRDVEFLCRSVDRNHLRSAVEALSRIVEENEDCAFDLTGGDELYLTAVGIVFERYREKGLQLHRFNIRNGTVVDCDEDGRIIAETGPELSIEENIRIYGGDVVFEEERANTTYPWEMTEDFRQDILAMWELCREDVRQWNAQCLVFAAAEKLREEGTDPMRVALSANALKTELGKGGRQYMTVYRIIHGLYEAGLLEEYGFDEERFCLTYKNAQVKRCLTLAGRLLEMRIFLAALEARGEEGEYVYNDVMQGVFIDWDGSSGAKRSSFDTENEIDVMLMHGMVPVFVSCKNGRIDKNELYKLNAVAERFGGAYAKKILVATALDQSDFAGYFRQRAADMGIRVVEGLQYKGEYTPLTGMDDAMLARTVAGFWAG